MKEETKYKRVDIYVNANGFTLYFRDYVGPFEEGFKTSFVAKTLDEVKKIMDQKLIK